MQLSGGPDEDRPLVQNNMTPHSTKLPDYRGKSPGAEDEGLAFLQSCSQPVEAKTLEGKYGSKPTQVPKRSKRRKSTTAEGTVGQRKVRIVGFQQAKWRVQYVNDGSTKWVDMADVELS